MQPSLGYFKAQLGQVCKMHCSLCGLKQASQQWDIKFIQFFLNLDFTQSKYDYSLFVKTDGTTFTAALVYVDDFLLTGNSTEDMYAIKAALHEYAIKDLGFSSYLLEIEISTTDHGIYLGQRKYIMDLIRDFGFLLDASVKTSLLVGLKLDNNTI